MLPQQLDRFGENALGDQHRRFHTLRASYNEGRMEKRVVVAIDGPAGAGKSTIARRVAAKLGFVYIDSGAMYRAVALAALRGGADLDDAERLEQLARATRIEFEPGGARVLLDGEDVSAAIRAPEISPPRRRSPCSRACGAPSSRSSGKWARP